jgi:hypothetical protein
MALETSAIRDAVISHAQTTGYFDDVQGHEPKNAPGRGINAAVYLRRVRPIAARSGLSSVSVLLVFEVRVFINMLREPQDDIDTDLMEAVDYYTNNLMSDFTLDGLISNVDIFGAHGQSYDINYGYMDQDKTKFRIANILLPLVINDVWTEAP